MALMECQECGHDVSTTAKACPNCGAKPKPPQQKLKVWQWLVTIVVLVMIYQSMTGPSLTPEQQAAKEKVDAAANAKADEKTRELVWIEKGKDAITARLKDPKSAQFKDVFFSRGKDNVPVACGRVNSKNGFGGFTGFQRFISAGSPDLTFLEGEVKDFTKAWNRFCTNAK